jgi:hypothetical protein
VAEELLLCSGCVKDYQGESGYALAVIPKDSYRIIWRRMGRRSSSGATAGRIGRRPRNIYANDNAGIGF